MGIIVLGLAFFGILGLAAICGAVSSSPPPKPQDESPSEGSPLAGAVAGGMLGGFFGSSMGLALGPLGAIPGALPGMLVGALIGASLAGGSGSSRQATQYSPVPHRDETRREEQASSIGFVAGGVCALVTYGLACSRPTIIGTWIIVWLFCTKRIGCAIAALVIAGMIAP